MANPASIKEAAFLSVEFKCVNLGLTTNWSGTNPMVSGSWTSFNLYQTIPPNAPGGDQSTDKSPSYLFVGTKNWAREDLSIDHKELNIYRPGAGGPPTQLELKLYVPAGGTIYLRPVKLWGIKHGWWSPQQSALIGTVGGSTIGCFCAIIGILAGLGKARRFVLTATGALIVGGILLVLAGIFAAATRQPYAVWYPLLLSGAILTFVLSINIYSIKRRYDDLEIRRMTSMDTAGGS
jgi:hypothetical protein